MPEIDPNRVCPQGLPKAKRRIKGDMRQAFGIFSYGLTQLFGNFGTALRLTGLIWLASSLLVFALGYVMIGTPTGASGIRPDVEGKMPALSATFTVVSLLITLLSAAWISLIWSRFCLGADTPRGPVPSLKGLPFSGYLLSLLLTFGLVVGAAFILGFVEGLILPYLPILASVFITPVISTYIVLCLFFRIGAALPATAAGQVLSLKQAWSGSRGSSIWLFAILAVLTVMILPTPLFFVTGSLLLTNIAIIVTSWLGLIIGTGWLVAIFRQIPPVQK